MRNSVLLLLIGSILFNCTGKQTETKEFSELNSDEQQKVLAAIPSLKITEQTKTRRIATSEAQSLVRNYREFIDIKIPFQLGGVVNTPIHQIIHDGLECKNCSETDKPGFPSYSINADTLRKILENKSVKKVVLYHAAHKLLANKYDFTIVIVGADDQKRAVQIQKPLLPSKGKSAAELEIWEYIDPCKPNCDMVN